MSLALLQQEPLPSAIDAEAALLGAVLYENDTFKRLGEPVAAEAFSEPYHQRLWAVIVDMLGKGRLAEPTSIAERLRGEDLFQTFGGLKYLSDLVNAAPAASTAPDYARRVNDAAQRRSIITICAEASHAARDPDQEPFSVVTTTDGALSALLIASAPDGAHLIDARTSMESTIARLIEGRITGKVRGAMTGLRCFDRRLGGLKPGKLIVVAGRPSMGKSGLCRAAAVGCARRNPDKDILYFTVEMEREEIDLRTMSQISYEMGCGFKYQDIEDDYERVGIDAIERIAPGVLSRVPANLVMDDSPRLSVAYVRRRLLAHMRKRPVAAVFIDYLQIMQRPEAKGRNDASIIGEMTTELKALTREGQCAVVLLSQLSRQCELRDNKRPMLADLRESGAIEQDANAVLFCYRDFYYLSRSGPAKGESEFDRELKMAGVEARMEVICAKQRGGPIGTDLQRYEAGYDFIEDID